MAQKGYMKSSTRLELRRKLAHTLLGIMLMALVWFVEEYYVRPILVILLLCGLFMSAYEKYMRIPLISKILDLLERPRQRNRFPGKGLIMFVAGTLLMSLFFNPLLIISGLLIITFGDPCGHIVGALWGKISFPWNKRKHLEGRLLGLLVVWIALILFWRYTMWYVPYGSLFIAAFFGMFLETLPHDKLGLDDNLTVPFATSMALYLLL